MREAFKAVVFTYQCNRRSVLISLKAPSSVFLYLDRTEPAGGEESRGEEAGAVIPVAGDIIA